MSVSTTSGLLLGVLLGLRHALEPDHLAAVSVLITRRRGAVGGMVLGAAWGIGHALALLAVGCALAAVGGRLPARWGTLFELLVAGMLLLLGMRAMLRRAHDAASAPRAATVGQPLMVGVMHGLAGSGPLTAAALATLPTTATRLSYIALFGLGSVVGMASLSGLVGLPLRRWEGSQVVPVWLSTVTGAVSLVLGCAWGWSAITGLLNS